MCESSSIRFVGSSLAAGASIEFKCQLLQSKAWSMRVRKARKALAR
jgi:hypothetical protein